MPFPTVNFKAGSYALIEGKKDSYKFYIVLKGKLTKIQESFGDSSQMARFLLGPGDFFGVESAMSRQKHIETVVAITDCTLIEVPAVSFGSLIEKSAPIAMKIIRSFSEKLRDFDVAIAHVSSTSASNENISHVFDIAEYWFQKGDIEHAVYAYQRYVQYAPNGSLKDRAIDRLKSLGKDLEVPSQKIQSIERNYKPDQIIFCESESGHELYIIRKGNIKITKIVDGQEVLLALVQPGDIVGEMALLDNKPRTASAIAANPVSVLVVNKANFEHIVKKETQLATKLITLLSERLWTAYKQLANLMIKDNTGRLLDILLTVAEKNHASVDNKVSYAYEFGAKDLLKMAGLDPQKDEALVLNIFQYRWLQLHNGKIICSNLLELQKHVNFYKKRKTRS